MSVNPVSNTLIKLDKISDQIPILSTITNIINIFQKIVVIPLLSMKTVENSHYYTYLKEKDMELCLLALLPVLGNIIASRRMRCRTRLIQGDL